MKSREHHLSVKVDAAELAQLHALAADRDETVSQMIRRWVREAHAARFGIAALAKGSRR